jgi:hypothetical protein
MHAEQRRLRHHIKAACGVRLVELQSGSIHGHVRRGTGANHFATVHVRLRGRFVGHKHASWGLTDTQKNA